VLYLLASFAVVALWLWGRRRKPSTQTNSPTTNIDRGSL